MELTIRMRLILVRLALILVVLIVRILMVTTAGIVTLVSLSNTIQVVTKANVQPMLLLLVQVLPLCILLSMCASTIVPCIAMSALRMAVILVFLAIGLRMMIVSLIVALVGTTKTKTNAMNVTAHAKNATVEPLPTALSVQQATSFN